MCYDPELTNKIFNRIRAFKGEPDTVSLFLSFIFKEKGFLRKIYSLIHFHSKAKLIQSNIDTYLFKFYELVNYQLETFDLTYLAVSLKVPCRAQNTPLYTEIN